MTFKFVSLSCLMMALGNASYIHGPSTTTSNNNYGSSSSTAQYVSQSVVRYPTSNTPAVTNSQGSNSQTENIIRNTANGQNLHLNSSQQKTVQNNPGHYSLSNQGKSDVRVTNPGTYGSNNYHSSSVDHRGNHEQQLNYVASTPSYNNNNNNNDGYQHSVSSSAYQQKPTPVYEHIVDNPAGAAIYTHHHSIPVYQYVTSAYALPAVGSSSSSYGVHNGNGYSQQLHNGNGYSQQNLTPLSSSSQNSGSHILGVPYSPAVAVSHMSYSSPVGISYAW